MMKPLDKHVKRWHHLVVMPSLGQLFTGRHNNREAAFTLCCETMNNKGSPCAGRATFSFMHRQLCRNHWLKALRRVGYKPHEVPHHFP